MSTYSTVLRFLVLSLCCATLLFSVGIGFAGMTLLNLNQATSAELEALPGIGPELADRIMEYKKTHGMFKSVEELGKVKGIGDKKLIQLKDLLSVKKAETQ